MSAIDDASKPFIPPEVALSVVNDVDEAERTFILDPSVVTSEAVLISFGFLSVVIRFVAVCDPVVAAVCDSVEAAAVVVSRVVLDAAVEEAFKCKPAIESMSYFR